MATKQPTVADIFKVVTELTTKIGRLEAEANQQHKEKMEKMAAIETQVKYTNGRVTALERRAEAQQAVEAYKQQEQQNRPSMQAIKVENNGWDWKTVLAVLLTLATAIAAIAGVKP